MIIIAFMIIITTTVTIVIFTVIKLEFLALCLLLL